MRKIMWSVLVACMAATLTSCQQEGNIGLKRWTTPEAGNYLVLMDSVGEKKGQVSYVGNGTVDVYPNQKAYEISGTRQESLYTSRSDQGVTPEAQAIEFRAKGTLGKVNLKVISQLDPTMESMGKFVSQYRTDFQAFEKNQLYSATQACVVKAAANTSPLDLQSTALRVFEKSVKECLTNSFDFMKLNIVAVEVSGTPEFGSSFDAVVNERNLAKEAQATESAKLEALQQSKKRIQFEAQLKNSIPQSVRNQELKEQELKLKEKAIDKGMNPFPQTIVIPPSGNSQ